MNVVLAVVVLFQLIVFPMAAKAESATTGRLLSYAELMRLPQDQRAVYIQGVREILIELSKNPDAKFSDVEAKNRSRLRAWLELVDSQVRFTIAEPAKTCAENPQCAVTLKSCLEGTSSFVKWNASKSVYECDLNRPAKSLVPIGLNSDISDIGRRLGRNLDPQFSSSQQTVQVQTADSQESPPSKEMVQIRPSPKSNDIFSVLRGKTPPRSVEELAQEVARGGVRIKDVSRCRSMSLPRVSTAESKVWEETLPECNQAEEQAIAKRYENTKSFWAPFLAPTAELIPEPAVAPAGEEASEGVRVFPVAAPAVANPRQLAGAVDLPSPSNKKHSSCAPKPASCESRAAIRRVYYQGSLPCVFAGMVSKLANGNRRCEAVISYKVGEKSLRCANGQTMCNPMLFGTVLGSNPETAICVGRGQNVTEHCGKISNARDAELFLNRNISGIQEKWDEFKRDLENVCKDGTVSSKFHCHECNLMRQRLFELHARVVKNPCETGIDDGIRQRIKDRSAPTVR